MESPAAETEGRSQAAPEAAAKGPEQYYVPHGSWWPIVGSIGLTLLVVGAARLLTEASFGSELMAAGGTLVLVMLVGWFGSVIGEGLAGRYNAQVGRSFRWGMGWFIFSEVMFFGAFFFALFYARLLSVPWLGGEGTGASTHLVLWPDFAHAWPLLQPPEAGRFDVPTQAVEAGGVPAYNTLILLTSSLTLTWAHWGLKQGRRGRLLLGMGATLLLGVLFLMFQAQEYVHAWQELNLKLSSGVYGSVFYLLTGFHGLHVTIGVIILAVMLMRALARHFTAGNHFAFEAASWYWHFVDLVWLFLFTFVYWL
jgi:cytochrome c oxidase subunit III